MAGELVGFLQALKDGGYLEDTLTEWTKQADEKFLNSFRYKYPTFDAFDEGKHFIIRMEDDMNEENWTTDEMQTISSSSTTIALNHLGTTAINPSIRRVIEDNGFITSPNLPTINNEIEFIQHCYSYGINAAERIVANGSNAISQDNKRQLEFILKHIYESLI